VGVGSHRAQKGSEGDSDPRSEVDVRSAAQVEGAQVAIGEVVRERAEFGELHAPAPFAGRQVQDLDLEGVTRSCVLDVEGPEQVVERVEVEVGLLERVALVHLTVPRHQEVVVHDVLRGDPQGGLQTVVPPMVDPPGVYVVLHAGLLAGVSGFHCRVVTGHTSTMVSPSTTSISAWRFAAAHAWLGTTRRRVPIGMSQGWSACTIAC